MTVSYFLDSVDLQSEFCVCYYDYNTDTRQPISRADAADKEIRYMYAENEIIFIEVDNE